jgi:hypothetical protein
MINGVDIYAIRYTTHKIMMEKMYDARKWIGMHGNKKSYLMFYFLHEYRIAPIVMQLNSS